MPQESTDRRPMQTAALPFREQLVIRLDEIIGLLDQVTLLLSEDRSTDAQPSPVELTPADPVDETQLVNLLPATTDEERPH